MADMQQTSINCIPPATPCQPLISIKWLGMDAAGTWACGVLIVLILELLVLAHMFISDACEIFHYQLILKPRYRHEIGLARLAVQEATLRLQQAGETMAPEECPVPIETTITQTPPEPDHHDLLLYESAESPPANSDVRKSRCHILSTAINSPASLGAG
ncbi:hypothetical protein TCE0_024f07705 [Talaromyces pinophilus]|uniref:Uncharacterized protein n=1 Tax=Talaromyces pinophilus TaxID=128442 RepID=A0A6V8H9C9_TALPI|nr:hypothetical protein TCE0_024f07705 [Talaromyces pinophilus]